MIRAQADCGVGDPYRWRRLAQAISTPAASVAVRKKTTAVESSCTDIDEVASRCSSLTVDVGTPAVHLRRRVYLAVVSSSCAQHPGVDLFRAVVVAPNTRTEQLSVGILAPAGDVETQPQRAGMSPPCADLEEGPFGWAGLTIRIGAPALNRTVCSQPTAVVPAGCDLHEGRGGGERLPGEVVTPAGDHPIRPKSAGVVATSRDTYEGPRRRIALPILVHAPALYFARGVDPATMVVADAQADRDGYWRCAVIVVSLSAVVVVIVIVIGLSAAVVVIVIVIGLSAVVVIGLSAVIVVIFGACRSIQAVEIVAIEGVIGVVIGAIATLARCVAFRVVIATGTATNEQQAEPSEQAPQPH